MGIDMKNSVLLVTDFYYQAKGREYYREDLELSGYLRKHFTLYMAHIADALELADHVDVVLLRNTGPQMLHREHLRLLQKRKELSLFNDLSGKGDIQGKKHLLELFQAGYPVIPSYSRKADIGQRVDRYLLKPLDGADSLGVQVVSWDELEESYPNMVVQPLLDFEYELSFYFINDTFYYALYAPDPKRRWELESYSATEEDIAFAAQFIRWNSLQHGIQRVDACRLHDGRLLLMELEDYNPFLSLDLVEQEAKERFLEAFV